MAHKTIAEHLKPGYRAREPDAFRITAAPIGGNHELHDGTRKRLTDLVATSSN
jgi:hypothetical protein